MKRLNFRELSLALGWMFDNATGHALIFNLKRTEIIIVRHKETAKELHEKLNQQLDEFDGGRKQIERQKNRLSLWFW